MKFIELLYRFYHTNAFLQIREAIDNIDINPYVPTVFLHFLQFFSIPKMGLWAQKGYTCRVIQTIFLQQTAICSYKKHNIS